MNFYWISILLFLITANLISGGNNSTQGTGCENKFLLMEMVALGAEFGGTLTAHEKMVVQSPLVLADPPDACTTLKNETVVLVQRGTCSFTTKAKLAQDAGASAIIVKNDRNEFPDLVEFSFLYRRVCSSIFKLKRKQSRRWAPDEPGSSGVDMNTKTVLGFVLFASVFLLISYKLMCDAFVTVLVIMFCMGGIEGLQTCLVAVLYRWFQNAGDSFIRVPYVGRISHLRVAVTPFCVIFGGVWAANHDISFAWISQNIFGITFIVAVLQRVRVTNLKVGSILLGCVFLYDVFWVFGSEKIFNESVMIVVAHGGKSSADGIPMLLTIPRMFDPWGGYCVVGLGDLILPGLVIAFALRYDYLADKTFRAGYFVWAMTAYGLGLLLTYVALIFMDGHGQPTLLYINSLLLDMCIVIQILLLLGKKRGELEILWNRGEPYMVCPHMRLQEAAEHMCLNEDCDCGKND
ncbi:hypothetical protein ACHQM5_005761 [Ranunculus cassubicifolius]